MSGHTKTPWSWLPNDGQFIVDDRGDIVAEVSCTKGNPADGAFIVRACNSHDELLEALENLVDVMQAAASRGDPVDQAWLERRIKKGSAAIRAARGE